MKIIYLLEAFPKLSETFILNQITGLIDRGHEIEILAFRNPMEEKVHEEVSQYQLFQKTHYIRFNQDMTFLDASNANQFMSCLDADIVHAHFATKPADIALEIFNGVGIPFIITAHAYDIFIHPDVIRLREKFLAAKKIITCSRYNKNYLVNLLGSEFGPKITVQSCGVNLSQFEYIERKPNQKVKILYVGRLVEKKGILDGLEAFRQVAERKPTTEFRIIGEGPLLEKAVDLVKTYKLDGVVQFLGSLPRESIIQEMKEADIFLLPSKKAPDGDGEGLPVVLLEAQAVGLPVVSTFHTGIPEAVVDGETGFLVPEGDSSAMGDRLCQLIENPEMRGKTGKAGRKLMESKFDHKNEMDRLEEIISDLAPSRKHSFEERAFIYFPQVIERMGEKINRQEEQIRHLQAFSDDIRNSLAFRFLRYLFRKAKNIEMHLSDFLEGGILKKDETAYPFYLPPLKGCGNDYSHLLETRFPPSDHYELNVSVVMPVYNRKDILAKTLAALMHQTYPKELIEIVIADDGSSDGVEDIIEKYKGHHHLRYLRQEHTGYGLTKVRNLGIKGATHDYIILLDCDMLPHPVLIEEYMKTFHINKQIVLIGHRRFVNTEGLSESEIKNNIDQSLSLPDISIENDILNPDKNKTPTKDWRLDVIYSKTDMLKKEPYPFKAFCGGNVAFKKEDALNAGLFCESFTQWGNEDIEFAYRLYNLGLYFIPKLEAEALHQEHPLPDTVASRKKDHDETLKIREQKVPLLRKYKKDKTYEVPKVSIYIPAFNAERFIKQAVDSVLVQSYTDLEVCICNDGSTDNTLDILEKNYRDDPRVHWATIPRSGIGKASNTAVRMCRGAYIGQLDSDDMLKQKAVEKLVKVLDTHHEVGCVYSTYQKIDENGKVIGKGYNWPVFSREKLLNNMIVHHFRMFRKRDWYRTKGFDETILNAVDYDMYMKLSMVTKFIHINKVLYQRRIHQNNTSILNESLQTKNTLEVVKKVLMEYHLEKEWEVAPLDPLNPRNVRFRKINLYKNY